MNTCVAILPLMLLFGLVLAGCDQPPVAGGAATPSGPPAPPAPPPPPETTVGAFAGGLDELAASNIQAPPAAEQPPLATDSETVKAEKGVGSKGRSLDQYEGPLVTPAKAYFAVRERVVFEIQIPDAMNKYKAIEGQAPKSHEEFMEKIVQANLIKLPMLPPGHEYSYDVETETLMVKRPKK